MDILRLQSLSGLEGVVHAISTRHGGVSRGPFESLNLGLHVGDDPEAVLENRRRLCAAAGIESDALVAGAQVLGNAVAWVTEADRGRGAAPSPSQGEGGVRVQACPGSHTLPLPPPSEREGGAALRDTDALVTDSPGVALIAFSADCPLVALVDPVRRAVGLAHASRRGTLGGIAAKAVRAMQRLLGCQPADLVAAIAPSIGPCCYEVGGEVLDEAREALPDAERYFARRDGRLYFDLWAANVDQLIGAGLAAERVEMSGVCTCCHADEFFSYRAARGATGRFALVLALTQGQAKEGRGAAGEASPRGA